MIRIHAILSLLLITTSAMAKIENVATKKTSCSNNNTTINFNEIKKTYTIYDKNSASVKIFSCEKIKTRSFQFYTVFFTSEVREGTETQRILTYEIALLDKKDNKLKTVRSETVDQLDQTTDSTNTTFENIIKTAWQYEKEKDLVLLKVNIENKKEKNEPYLLIYNKKNQWFEDYFPNKDKKK